MIPTAHESRDQISASKDSCSDMIKSMKRRSFRHDEVIKDQVQLFFLTTDVFP